MQTYKWCLTAGLTPCCVKETGEFQKNLCLRPCSKYPSFTNMNAVGLITQPVWLFTSKHSQIDENSKQNSGPFSPEWSRGKDLIAWICCKPLFPVNLFEVSRLVLCIHKPAQHVHTVRFCKGNNWWNEWEIRKSLSKQNSFKQAGGKTSGCLDWRQKCPHAGFLYRWHNI